MKIFLVNVLALILMLPIILILGPFRILELLFKLIQYIMIGIAEIFGKLEIFSRLVCRFGLLACETYMDKVEEICLCLSKGRSNDSL